MGLLMQIFLVVFYLKYDSYSGGVLEFYYNIRIVDIFRLDCLCF